jgi:hypothetical protein
MLYLFLNSLFIPAEAQRNAEIPVISTAGFPPAREWQEQGSNSIEK